MLNEALNDPDRWSYSDIAIAPPQSDEFEALCPLSRPAAARPHSRASDATTRTVITAERKVIAAAAE